MMRYRVELSPDGAERAVTQFIHDFLATPELHQLVEAEGGTWPTGDLDEVLPALREFSSRWDFRRGDERLDVHRDEAAGHNLGTIERAGFALGLTVAHDTLGDAYDHALVLGGTALSSVYRVRRLFELRRGGIEVRSPAVLTALRPVGHSELELLRARSEDANLATGVKTEFDLITRAVSSFAGAEPVVDRSGDQDPHRTRATAQVGDTLVLAASSANPGRRATTRDNYDAYAERIAPNDDILLITSSLYLPFQLLLAVQTLGRHGPCMIEAVGFPPDWMQGVLTGPMHVLQELRSAFWAANDTLGRSAADGRPGRRGDT